MDRYTRVRATFSRCVQTGPDRWEVFPVIVDIDPGSKVSEALADINRLWDGPTGKRHVVCHLLFDMEPGLHEEDSGAWRAVDADTAFAPPFGTVRECGHCGCLVAGGPTACVRCVKDREDGGA